MNAPTSPSRTVLIVFCALAVPMGLAAEDANTTKHHHYQFFDLGTFGGPASFINPPFNVNPELSSRGTTAGASATSVSVTSTSNFFGVCGGLDGLVQSVYHAFEWQNGTVLDLGAFPPADENCSNALAVSESGDLVVGGSENEIIDPILGVKELRAVLWRSGHIKDLGTLGGSHSLANSLNDHGQVAGFALNAVPDPFSFYYLAFLSSNGTQTRAFLWDKNNGMRDLGTLGTGNDAFASFLNARGQVAGFAYTNAIPNPTTGIPTVDPFLWDKRNGMQDLGTFGGTFGNPTALNNRGEVIGFSNLSGDQSFHPFLWEQGNLLDLYTNTSGGNPLTADAISEEGEIVGAAAFPNQSSDAYLWRKGVATDLGHLEGDCGSRAWAINSKNQIAGVSLPCAGIQGRAFLWENDSIVDLNTLVPPGSSLKLLFPMAINDRGEITGTGVPPGCGDDDGGTCGRAFFIIPCDEGHPDIEGCDYSPVEVSTVAASHATETQKRLTPQEISRIRALLMKRHRGFMPTTMR
jgi:probable HAF family extracellular repeat protein